MKKHIFLIFHPVVIFLYFVAAIVCAMLTRHPVYIGISFTAASIYCVYLKGFRQYGKTLLMLLPMLLIIAGANALFSGMGLTVLFYMGGRPVTAEAFAYGLSSGFMLGAVLLWFQCYQEVMDNDKFLWLFGKPAPVIAMMVSMIFRFIPETIRKAGQISRSQKALLGKKEESRKQQTAHAVRMASILMSWSMESSIETADSMRARGYGANKRTTYERYRMRRYDWAALIILAASAGFCMWQILTEASKLMYYPVFIPAGNWWPAFAVYAFVLLYPLILEGREQLLWLRLNS